MVTPSKNRSSSKPKRVKKPAASAAASAAAAAAAAAEDEEADRVPGAPQQLGAVVAEAAGGGRRKGKGPGEKAPSSNPKRVKKPAASAAASAAAVAAAAEDEEADQEPGAPQLGPLDHDEPELVNKGDVPALTVEELQAKSDRRSASKKASKLRKHQQAVQLSTAQGSGFPMPLTIVEAGALFLFPGYEAPSKSALLSAIMSYHEVNQRRFSTSVSRPEEFNLGCASSTECKFKCSGSLDRSSEGTSTNSPNTPLAHFNFGHCHHRKCTCHHHF